MASSLRRNPFIGSNAVELLVHRFQAGLKFGAVEFTALKAMHNLLRLLNSISKA